MTAWTSSELPEVLRVPGVYGVRRSRVRREPIARTDVAGFVGFDPRIRPLSAALAPAGGPGHDFRIVLAECRVPLASSRTDDQEPPPGDPADLIRVTGNDAFELSADPFTVPMAVGEAVRFTLAAVDATWTEEDADREPAPFPMTPADVPGEALKRTHRRRNVVVVAGAAAVAGRETAPDDVAVANAVVSVAMTAWGETASAAAGLDWARLADVQVRRTGADAFRIVARPAARLIRCDDWRDYVLRLGLPAEDGTYLGRAVRGFFANGGARCYISTVDRPEFDDAAEVSRALIAMAGDDADSAREATGVVRLLQVPEVAILDLPDLHAVRIAEPETITLPPGEADACFRPCTPAATVIAAAGPADLGEPVYDAATVTQAQIDLVERCADHRWRVFLLLSPPITRDPATGRFGPPSLIDAEEWRTAFHDALTAAGLAEEASVAALYYPWLVVQETAGDADRQLPPSGFAAGVFAARDRSRGPVVSPANEKILTAVAATTPVDDEALADLYDPFTDANGNARPAVNILRAAPGGGVELWGARTLSTESWLRFIAVRRGLSAVQRRCHAGLQRTVFEPHTPALWMQVTQIALNILMSLFQSGALRGNKPEEAFYVRCDSSVNPPESISEGKLFVEVGVAIAAPAEFIVFRIGRDEGVVEVLE